MAKTSKQIEVDGREGGWMDGWKEQNEKRKRKKEKGGYLMCAVCIRFHGYRILSYKGSVHPLTHPLPLLLLLLLCSCYSSYSLTGLVTST
jgi:hypothetical protein